MADPAAGGIKVVTFVVCRGSQRGWTMGATPAVGPRVIDRTVIATGSPDQAGGTCIGRVPGPEKGWTAFPADQPKPERR